MFGFGKKAKEESAQKEAIRAWIIDYAGQFMGMGIPDKQAIEIASSAVNDILTTMGANGIDAFAVQGDEAVNSSELMQPRQAAGLSLEEVRTYWNLPAAKRVCDRKVFETYMMMFVQMRHSGADTSKEAMLATLREFQRKSPRYGDPAKWDATSQFNNGLTPADADIYPEFEKRVNAWMLRTSAQDLAALASKHGTINAAIRQLVAAKEI